MADSIVGGFKADVHLATGREPEPSTHFDPRMHLTIKDMYYLSGDDKAFNKGERVLPPLVFADLKDGQ
jgi:hypothetical protein